MITPDQYKALETRLDRIEALLTKLAQPAGEVAPTGISSFRQRVLDAEARATISSSRREARQRSNG